MRTLTSAIDTLYRDPFFGRTIDLSLQVLLRWQQLNYVVLGTVFTGVRELAGLPTAAQIEALRAEMPASTLSHAGPNGHQEVQRTVKRDLLVNEEQKIVLNIIGEYDDVVHPQSSLPLVELVGSRDTHNLRFPTGHIGAVVSSAAHVNLWPQVGAWLKERNGTGN